MLIKCTIAGDAPILCNRFSDAAAEQTSAGTSSAVRSGSKGTPRDQATPKLYLDGQGHPVIPGPNIFRAIIDAGRFHKMGKSQITTNKSSLVPAGITLVDLDVPLIVDGKPAVWEVDSRSVVIPATGGRVMCHRPRFDRWSLTFTLEVDPKMFDETLVRKLVDDAGAKIGLGDFRPARKGPFGRFKVTLWKNEVLKVAA